MRRAARKTAKGSASLSPASMPASSEPAPRPPMFAAVATIGVRRAAEVGQERGGGRDRRADRDAGEHARDEDAGERGPHEKEQGGNSSDAQRRQKHRPPAIP